MRGVSEQTVLPIWHFVCRLIMYQPVLYVFDAICWILFHIWPLFLGLLAKAFFDMLEGKNAFGLDLLTIVALVVVSGFTKSGIIYIASVVGIPLTFRMRGLVQRNILARILERPGAKAVPGSIGDAISTLRDDGEATYVIAGWAYDVLAAILFAGGGLAVLLWVNMRITILVFLPISMVIIIANAVRKRLQNLREQSREATARVTGGIGEIFSTVQAIQVAGAEKHVVGYIRQLGEKRQIAVLRDLLQEVVLDAIFSSLTSLGIGLTLLAAAAEMRAGIFSIGDFALFASYLMYVTYYNEFLGHLVITYQKSQVSVKRMVAMLQGAPAQNLVKHYPLYLSGELPVIETSVKEESDRLINFEVKDLLFRYDASGFCIKNISFKVERGKLIVITGRIGSGKTTLLRAALGLLDLQAGHVYWNNQKVDNIESVLVPPRVGYVPQTPVLLSGTLRDNILLGIPNDHNKLQRAIHNAVLEGDMHWFVAGLDTAIGAKGVSISGGQIQRTAAARAFVREPELLVFDDISSALDVNTENMLWERIFERETTYLVVSHRPKVLKQADQILVMENGCISGRGTLEELLGTNEEMRRLWGGGMN